MNEEKNTLDSNELGNVEVQSPPPQPNEPVNNEANTSTSPITGDQVGNNSTNGETSNTAQQSPKKSHKRLPLLIVILLFLIAGGVAAWYMLQPKESVAPNVAQQVSEIALLKIGSTEGPVNKTFPSEVSSGVNVSANVQLYEGLVESKNGSHAPLLAESWTNPDQSTWVFKIKPGVKFQTGKEMMAEDIKASIESVREVEFWSSFVSTIDTVEATGEYEITIKTTTPDTLLLNRLSRVYIRDVQANTESGLDGTGAYSINKEAENTDTVMHLKAFEDYHQGSPKTKAIEYVIFDDETEVIEALKSGEIDVYEQSTITSIEGAEENNIKKVEFELAGSNGIFLNLIKDDSLLNNPKIREAIAYAIDREDLLQKLDNPELVPAYQMVPKTLAGHVSDLNIRKNNIEKAKELLAEAEYDGKTELEFIYFDGVQLEPPILIEHLKEAGFAIKATAYSSPDEMFGAVENKNFDLFSSTYTSDIADARDVFGSVTISENPTFAGVESPELQALLTASDKEFDPTKRTEALQAVNRYIHDNILWIPVRNSKYNTFYRGDVAIDAKEAVDFSSVKYWQIGKVSQN